MVPDYCVPVNLAQTGFVPFLPLVFTAALCAVGVVFARRHRRATFTILIALIATACLVAGNVGNYNAFASQSTSICPPGYTYVGDKNSQPDSTHSPTISNPSSSTLPKQPINPSNPLTPINPADPSTPVNPITPTPLPKPTNAPTPDPVPNPNPNPNPAPNPTPTGKPVPTPNPDPTPTPDPQPVPNPSPSPSQPQPQPEPPKPNPDNTPTEVIPPTVQPAPIPTVPTVANDPFVEKCPWRNRNLPIEKRVEMLMDKMTPAHLINMSHGASNLLGIRPPGENNGPKSIGYIRPIPELCVPALVMTDGPSGLRNREKATEMPAPIVQGASFDVKIAELVGQAIAEDSRDRGQDLLFGPGFNLGRNPAAGRTFEYFGEDPLLSGQLAAANANGLQKTGIMATLKHFVANNQETFRTINSSNMDQRTLHEIYEKPFLIGVQGSNPASVMCAYNMINNVYACSNRQTQVEDLRGRMGFNGFVVSDYPATHETTDLANGLNVELPGSVHVTLKKVEAAVAENKMTWDDVKLRVKETLTQMFRFGLFDQPWDEKAKDRQRTLVDLPVDRGYEYALKTIEAGAVLLKNDGVLPLKPADLKGKKILVVGEGAKNSISGGGSSGVSSIKKDSLLEELKKALPETEIIWRSNWNPAGIAIQAKKADLVIAVASVISTELIDRLNIDFFPHMNIGINAAVNNNPNTIVVTQIPGPTMMPWANKTRAILNVWYPGAAGGLGTTNLLLGKTNPSGRLPQTFPADPKEIPASTTRQFPGEKAATQAYYDEGVFMGYRWWGQYNKPVAYPFGYGLSYTTFAYSDAKLLNPQGSANDPVKVSVIVQNTGRLAGAVVPQVYVGKPSSSEIPTPPKELGAFGKVYLQPGESKRIELTVLPRELQIYDVTAKGGTGDYVVRPGAYKIYVADNVNDVKASFDYQVR